MYYPDEGFAITARLPGRHSVAVKVMARRMGLKKSVRSTSGFRPWSDEEWQKLESNMHLGVAEQLKTCAVE